MARMTRRMFLVCSGVTAGTALAAGGTALTWDHLVAAARDRPLDKDAGILVLITLYGGNDGLNTVVPASDPVYQDSRPGLAYSPAEVLDLGHGLGLNPAMTGFKALWDGGKLAIVRGVSYPRPDHSHFRSMAIWQTASPAGPAKTGWLGRWLDAVGHDPLRAIALEPALPPVLAGARGAGSTLLPEGRPALPKGPTERDLQSLARRDPADGPVHAWVVNSLRSLLAVDARVGAVTPAPLSAGRPPGDSTGSGTPGANIGASNRLALQLATIARCLEINVPTRVYCASLSGFDTHSDEKGLQSALVGQLDTAVAAFLNTVRTTAPGRKVVVAIYSEFGRRVNANANQGTDHGTAGPMFIAGEDVAGGFHGDQPSLTRLDNGDLFATTDFRDVYATLLSGVLDTDPERVLGPGRKPLALL